MKFAVITHIIHKSYKSKLFSYEPYVREMNLWFKHVVSVKVLGAHSTESIEDIEESYQHNNLELDIVPSIDITSFKNAVKAIVKIPFICFKIVKTMFWADHIHLRCPSNIGLFACFIQIFFPKKPKTVKYAGNWDPKSRQPRSYRMQKWILSNTFLTRNCKVLVYGKWENQTKNIHPFFTASYTNSEIVDVPIKKLSDEIRFIFVGGLTKGKQPLKTLQVIHELKKAHKKVKLDFYGDGIERQEIENYILENKLSNDVILHGNVSKQEVKSAFQKAHFLLFMSKSEGWPKVIAEAMFWGCVPITTSVSCIPYMLDNGKRGTIINDDVTDVVDSINRYLRDESLFRLHASNGLKWSRKFTLEKFEIEIKRLLEN